MAPTDREKALDSALAHIEKQFGKGAIMRLGEDTRAPIEVIPTGAISLDVALGIGGLPRGRIVEIYGPEASGKCLTADALIPTNWGLLTVAEIFERCGTAATCTSRTTDVAHLGLRVLNEYGEMEPVTVLTHNNRKPTLTITTNAGRAVTVTHNHPIRVLNRRGTVVWRNAGDLAVGDVVLGIRGGDPDAKDQITVDEALLLGYLIGDGHVTPDDSVMFSQVDREIAAQFRSLVSELHPTAQFTVYEQRPNDIWVRSRAFRDYLEHSLGLGHHRAADKEIPITVRASGAEVQRAFLSALFECDGGVESGTVCLSTASETLAVQVQAMLATLGITASRTAKRVAAYPDNTYWTIRCTGAGSQRFVAEIGFQSSRRAEQMTAVRSTASHGLLEYIPHQVEMLRDLRDAIGGDRGFDTVAGDVLRTKSDGTPFVALSPTRLRRIVAWAEEHGAGDHAITVHLRALLSRPATYETVVAIEDAGERPTFDLMVPGTHSFVANGLAVHNTTLALHAIASVQQQGGIAAIIDAEHALDPLYAGRLGVDLDSLYVAQPDTGEQALEIADTLVRSGALDLIVIDSVAALVPRAEIEGEMGDSHVGLQARLMSQALRKMAGALSNSKTTAIFINQLREKIGVMFGCFSYNTRVTLGDGTQEKIGKIVNQKLPVEVRTYDPVTNTIVNRPVTNWFDNGPAERFLQFTVARSGGNGRSQFAATENHLIRTPGGWTPAGEIIAGDSVLTAEEVRLSSQQWQLILGSLMGDGSLSPNQRGRRGVRFWVGHGRRQREYLNYKSGLLGNIGQSQRQTDNAAFVDCMPLPELEELHEAVYLAGDGKMLSDEYLKALTPFALAVWYMDDADFDSGRTEFCVEALTPGSRARLQEYLRDTWGIRGRLRSTGAAGKAVLTFDSASSRRFHELVAPYVHPSMAYKLLPEFRGRFSVTAEHVAPRQHLVRSQVLDVHVKPPTRSMHRFDIEVEGTHNYFVDGVLVHNSPETTTGGRALKFYSSVRLDVRRIETLKGGTEAVGNRTRVKVVKNKCLAEGTMIFDPVTGVSHDIRAIVDGRLPVHVTAVDKKGQFHTRPVISWFDQGEQETIGIQLRGGAEIWVTPDHRVLTDKGWIEAHELRPGSLVATPRHIGGFGTSEPINPDEARLLGYLIGDGYVGGKTPVQFINCQPALHADAAAIAATLGCDAKRRDGLQVSFSHRPGEKNGVLELCRWAGIWGSLAWEKKIPAELLAQDVSSELLGNLLFGLYESDGWVSKEPTGALRVGYATTSEQLAHQVHRLLLRWGISSSVRRRDPRTQRGGLVRGRRIQGTRPCWEVRVAGSNNVQRFAEAVPMWGPRGVVLTRELASDQGRRRGGQNGYVSPSLNREILEHLRQRGLAPADVAALIGDMAGDPIGGMKQVLGTPRIRRDRLAALANALDDPFLHDVLADQITFATVRRVLPPVRRRTFDVEVEEHHNLVANGVVVHNCAPPFKQAEFDILYGEGISREGSLIDLGVDQGIVRKSGAWYTYEGDQLGQGKENARAFLRDNPDLGNEIEKRIKEQLGVIPRVDEPAEEETPQPSGGEPKAGRAGGAGPDLVPPTPIDL